MPRDSSTFTCKPWQTSTARCKGRQRVQTEPRWVLPAIDQELEKLRAQLADLSSHYTDRHPDVRKVKEQIAKTEKLRDQLLGKPENEGSRWRPQARTIATGPPGADTTQATLLAPIQSQLRSNQAGNHQPRTLHRDAEGQGRRVSGTLESGTRPRAAVSRSDARLRADQSELRRSC